MRKSLFILLTVLVVALCSSCRKDKDEPTPPSLASKTIIINVPQESWQYSEQNSNNFFFATIEMPEITKAVFDYGIVKVYRIYDFDKSYASQIELPYIHHNEYEKEGGVWDFYTETVDYDFEVKKMRIYYTVSDFDYELNTSFIPQAMQFRCVILN